MAVVVWDESAWREVYPQFDEGQPWYCTSAQLSGLWQIATTLVDNTNGAAIPYDPSAGVYVRQILLWALMCHLATLAWQGRQGQYGTLTNATEGSVTAGFTLPTLPVQGVTGAWYGLTACGLMAWTLLRRYALGGVSFKPPHYHPWG
jgi:hypothetical protein